MPERFGDIVGGLDEALRKIQAENAGRIGGASTFLAQQIVRLKDWAADQEELIPTKDLHPSDSGVEK